MSLYFIDYEDFTGEVNLDLSNDTNVLAQFNAFAESVVYDTLNDLLNAKLYNELIADLDGNGDPQSSQFVNLVDGTAYEYLNGETINYQGFVKMLKYFVYEQYLDSMWSNNTSLGQMLGQNENMQNLDLSQLRKVRKRIQHKAVLLYYDAVKFINDNYSTYFTNTNDYTFWKPVKKTFLGEITTQTVTNNYFRFRSSEDN